MSLFQTKITVEPDTPIIALSDIHADIDSLIIALRDCAQVIKKKTNQNVIKPDGTESEPQLKLDDTKRTEENIREEAGDQLLEYLLSLDLNVPENDELFKLNVDLGYEWIGGKSHVVIIGDILDGKRKTLLKSTFKQYVNQYPQVEVKILMFLNKLDELAASNEGKVIKLIGNHEHVNFTKNKATIESFAFSNDIPQKKSFYDPVYDDIRASTYYNGISRMEYFNIDRPGYELYKERGTGILLLIDNGKDHLIFCHGTLTNQLTYGEIDEINTNINNNNLQTNYNDTTINYSRNFKNLNDQTNSILWARDMGEDSKINNRFDNNTDFCENHVNTIINNFCKDSECENDKVKIILGHCTQNYSSYYDTRNRTFKTVEEEDSKRIIYNGKEIHEGLTDFSRNIIFGITMECDSPKSDSSRTLGSNKRIFRVDVGSSRGFDQDLRRVPDRIQKNKDINQIPMKKYLHSRTPQVLYIKDGDFKIIKSKYENTQKHQPRVWVEEEVDSNIGINSQLLPRLTATIVQPGGYYQKYLKYKQKYLQLKKTL
jgi:hypothetical protein